MTSLSDLFDEAIPMPAPSTPNLVPLAAELHARGYTDTALAYVLAYAGDRGTLEGCLYVDSADRADLDAILEDAWPAVGFTSSAWDESPWRELREQPTWTLARADRIAALAEAHGTTLYPPELEPEAPDPSEEDEAFYAAWVAAAEAELEASAVLVPDPEIFPLHF